MCSISLERFGPSFLYQAWRKMILAATFATWYWTFHKSDVPFFVLTRSFFYVFNVSTLTAKNFLSF